MNKPDILKIKKFMSFALKHKPFFYKIKLNSDGYAPIDSLVAAAKNNLKLEVTKEDLIEIVKTLSGGIFKISKDGDLIAARSGHTIIFNMNVPAGFEPCDIKTIPNELYARIDKKDFYCYMNSDIIPLSNKATTLSPSALDKTEENIVIKISSKKLDSNKNQVYYNKESNLYFTKFVSKNSIVINV